MSDELRQRIVPVASAVAIIGIATIVALFVRFQIVEPEHIAAACAAGDTGLRCIVRNYAVAGFLHDVFGMTALVAGVIATISRWRSLALLAMVSGAVGAVLYRYELSGAGLLLGALVWVQSILPPAVSPREVGGDEQQSQS